MCMLAHVSVQLLYSGWTYRGSSGGEEDQRTKVGGALVGESAGSVDESTDTVGLDTGADNGASP